MKDAKTIGNRHLNLGAAPIVSLSIDSTLPPSPQAGSASRQRPRCRLINRIAIGLSLVSWVGCIPGEQLPPDVREQLLNPHLGLEIAPAANSSQPSVPVSVAVTAEISDEKWIDLDSLPWEYAEVHYLRGRRIGYSLVTVSRSDLVELNQLRIERTDVVDRTPDGSPAPLRKVVYRAIEKPNGEMSSFTLRSTLDGAPDLEVDGRMIFSRLDLSRKEQEGTAKRSKADWPKGAWGPLGIQELLMRKPMIPGEIREAQVYIPQWAQFAKARLEAKQLETTPVAGNAAPQLLGIDVSLGNEQSSSLSRIWVDAQGVIQKTVTYSGESIMRVRVDASLVRRLSDQGEFERLIDRSIELSGNIEMPSEIPELTVEVKSLELDPFGQFLASDRQELRSINASACEIKTKASPTHPNDDPDSSSTDPSADAPPAQPEDIYLASSSIVPSDNPLIAEIAAELLGDKHSASPEQRVEQLRAGLGKQWNSQSENSEIKSTLAAARARGGSSIECASLLCALIRQQKIPCRQVGGLLIDRESSTVRFHAWNQVWLGDQWRDIDAITPTAFVGPFHLAMTTTDASGDNPYRLWLPVLKVIHEILGVEIVANEGGEAGSGQ